MQAANAEAASRQGESQPAGAAGEQLSGDPDGGATPQGRRGQESATAQTITFGDDEGSTVEASVPDTGGDIDAAEVVGDGDTSHNRHGADEHEVEGEGVNEVGEFVLETLNAMGIKPAGRAKLMIKLVHARSVHDVYEALKGEVTPEAVLEVGGKVAKHFGWEAGAELAENAAPAVAGTAVGLEFAELSMKYIIGPANKESRESGQLNRYAAAWARRFLDDGYAPEMLAEVDEQTALMNTCTRLGVEDAIKMLAKLGDRAPATRRELIAHYGSIAVARENLVLELLKQAGVK